ncbi:hyalin-like isoform X2 [Lytechinus variegatus]|uniref:hyalin-like isoform X2 n=1 Tax=Lytechinus variegatus TaxID=7654 RepID=UPI001BB15BBB|nr:hyalin-like isoform X2 [Lytechinus variegatus]
MERKSRGYLCVLCILIGFLDSVSPQMVFLALNQQIMYANLTSEDTHMITDSRFMLISTVQAAPSSIDYDPVDQRVYWSSHETHQIGRVRLDGSDDEVINGIPAPTDAIALDTTNRKIYWAVLSRYEVWRADLDGSNNELILGSLDMLNAFPSGLGIDPISGILFVSGLRAGLDGSSPIQDNPMTMMGRILSIQVEQCPSGFPGSKLWRYTEVNEIDFQYSDGSGRTVVTMVPSMMTTDPRVSFGKYGAIATLADYTTHTLLSVNLTSGVSSSHSDVTLTDGNTLSTYGTSTVRVVEGSPSPVIANCPSDVAVAINSTTTSVTVSWTEPSISDTSVCADLTFLGPGTNGGNYSVGSWTQTYQATGFYANTMCSFTINITVSAADNGGCVDLDANCPMWSSFCTTNIYAMNNCKLTCNLCTDNTGSPPVISGCPSNQNVNTDIGNATALVTWTPPTASDSDGTQTLTSTDNPGDYFPIGNNTVTYTSTDNNGYTDTCTFSISVSDNENPVIIGCPSNQDFPQFGQSSLTLNDL